MNKLELILSLLLKESGAILPLFVHDAKSQTITAVVVGEASQVLNAVSALQAAKPKA
jgi:hypothetical protein